MQSGQHAWLRLFLFLSTSLSLIVSLALFMDSLSLLFQDQNVSVLHQILYIAPPCHLEPGTRRIDWRRVCGTGSAAPITTRQAGYSAIISIYLSTFSPTCSLLSIIINPTNILPLCYSLANLAWQVPCNSFMSSSCFEASLEGRQFRVPFQTTTIFFCWMGLALIEIARQPLSRIRA